MHSTQPPPPSIGTTSYQPCRPPLDHLHFLFPWQRMQEMERRRCGSTRQHGPSPHCPETLVPPSRFYATLYALFSLPDEVRWFAHSHTHPSSARPRAISCCFAPCQRLHRPRRRLRRRPTCTACPPPPSPCVASSKDTKYATFPSIKLHAFILLHHIFRFQKLTFCSCLCACSRHHVRSCQFLLFRCVTPCPSPASSLSSPPPPTAACSCDSLYPSPRYVSLTLRRRWGLGSLALRGQIPCVCSQVVQFPSLTQ